jgi:hypothetical protein
MCGTGSVRLRPPAGFDGVPGVLTVRPIGSFDRESISALMRRLFLP